MVCTKQKWISSGTLLFGKSHALLLHYLLLGLAYLTVYCSNINNRAIVKVRLVEGVYAYF